MRSLAQERGWELGAPRQCPNPLDAAGSVLPVLLFCRNLPSSRVKSHFIRFI